MYEFVKTEDGWQVCWGLVPAAAAKNTENGETLTEAKDAESSSEQILLRRLAGRCAARRAANTHKRRDLVLN